MVHNETVTRMYQYDEESISFTNDMKLFKTDTENFKKDTTTSRNLLGKLWICSAMCLIGAALQYILRRLS